MKVEDFARLETTPSNVILEAIRQVREQIGKTLRLRADEIGRLEQSLELLRNQQRETEEATRHLFEPIEKTLAEAGNACAPSIQSVWTAVRNLMTATYPEQVLEVLAAEAAQMNLRAAVFSVRGKAAWGTSANGFEISNQDLFSLVVPLNRENPFRQVFETSEALETNAEGLRGNPNVLEELSPAPGDRLWLLPIRSAESVTAILYADTGESENSILADSLRLLAEFAGLQLDRLTVLSGGLAVTEVSAPEEHARMPEPAEVPAPETETAAPSPEAESPEAAVSEPSLEVAPTPPAEEAVVAPVAPEEQEILAAEAAPGIPQTLNLAALSDEDQKVHRDAQRFSRLLVSEVELYNKEKVEEGRKNKDLYQRLKKDIDRSRQTYEKRFGNSAVKQVDYFHEELVRALAENDPLLLGSDYPGPSA